MSDFVKCKCQHCGQGIEFDASDFAEAETRNTPCPHCGLETLLFVPFPGQDRPTLGARVRTLAVRIWQITKRSFQFIRKARWVQAIATTKFERLVFSIIRGFVLFWAALVVLLMTLATVRYVFGFYSSKPTNPIPREETFAESMAKHESFWNFVVYGGVMFFLLMVLTIISLILILLAIERNTRRPQN